MARFGDREALVDVPTGRRWTYTELDVDVDAVALGLLALGIDKGDRVGIWAPNCAEWVLVQYATAKIGAILVNINPAYRSHELKYVLNQSGMRMLVSAPAHKTSDYRAMIDEVRRRVPGAERRRLPRRGLLAASWPSAAAGPTITGWTRGWRRCRSTTRSTSSTRRAPPASPRAPRCRTTTSSTTATSSTEVLGYTEHDRVCIPVPFYHCFGMVMGNLGGRPATAPAW